MQNYLQGSDVFALCFHAVISGMHMHWLIEKPSRTQLYYVTLWSWCRVCIVRSATNVCPVAVAKPGCNDYHYQKKIKWTDKIEEESIANCLLSDT